MREVEQRCTAGLWQGRAAALVSCFESAAGHAAVIFLSDPKPKSVWYLIGEYSGLAFMMPTAAVLGFFLGLGLDHLLHTHRVFAIVGLLLGIAAGLLELVRVLNKTSRSDLRPRAGDGR